LRLVPPPFTSKKAQVDRFLRVLVGNSLEQVADRNFNPKFLSEFTSQAFLEAFIRLTLAPREFPKTPQMRISITLGDEEFALAENQTGSDIDGWHG